jgi:hypothetical protein
VRFGEVGYRRRAFRSRALLARFGEVRFGEVRRGALSARCVLARGRVFREAHPRRLQSVEEYCAECLSAFALRVAFATLIDQ